MNIRKSIYADNAATTPLDPAALEAMLPFLQDFYANPSSLYSICRPVKKALQEARETIAECIGALPDELFFTSGGSESDNWAIKNFVFSASLRKRQILTSPIEHHAILNSCTEAANYWGFTIVKIPVDQWGVIDVDEYLQNITKHTAGISIMLANNEVGTIEDIKKLAGLAQEYGIPFHTDAVQAVGHIPIAVRDLGVNMLSASGHKFNGPKGVGFLYIKRNTSVINFVNGGQQEQALRAGTENVASIVGMAVALKNNCSQMQKNISKLQCIENQFKETLSGLISGVIFNGKQDMHLPGLVSLSIPGYSGESLLHILDLKGIAVSTGAACNSKKTKISHVLKAMNCQEKAALGTLRISFGKYNSIEEAQKLAQVLSSAVQKAKS